MKKIVVIVAGGRGKRMKSSMPKQFLLLAGRPVIMHTIEAFVNYDPDIEIRLVLPHSQLEIWNDLCSRHDFTISHLIFNGGATRFHSVKNGLAGIEEGCLVAVHDGVRPLVSENTIHSCYVQAEKEGAVIPVAALNDSLRMIKGQNSIALDRARYRLVQTPQVFKSELLISAYKTQYMETFTDDASVVEAAGHEISLCDGNIENIKITSPMDMSLAETLLSGQK